MRVENDGPHILRTDYWTTEHAHRGLFYLSINAGAFRLLVPKAMESELVEMRTGKMAVISFGTDTASGKAASEVLFDDGTPSPYSIVTSQFDRRPAETRRDRTRLLVYSERGLEFELPAHYRKVESLPCLQPWTGN